MASNQSLPPFRIGGKIRFDLFYVCTLDRVPATDSVVSLEMLKQQASETKFLWPYVLKIVFTRWVSIHFFSILFTTKILKCPAKRPLNNEYHRKF